MERDPKSGWVTKSVWVGHKRIMSWQKSTHHKLEKKQHFSASFVGRGGCSICSRSLKNGVENPCGTGGPETHTMPVWLMVGLFVYQYSSNTLAGTAKKCRDRYPSTCTHYVQYKPSPPGQRTVNTVSSSYTCHSGEWRKKPDIY